MGKKNIPYIEETYDVVVVGAGHAGCEAALACARLGLETMMFTVSVDSIALMPCNPNIGGSSKGHLVREIDALGGEMGKNIDKTFIQSKMLNKSKGPAVHSLRAQADKAEYTKEMRKTLQNTDYLSIRQAEVAEILTNKDKFFPEDEYHEGEEQKITGVRTVSGGVYRCKAVVLCTGTYLRARCLTGEMITHTGPNGLSAANHLTDSLLMVSRQEDLKQEHRRVSIKGVLIFQKWKSSLEMKELFRFLSQRIRRMCRSSRLPAG